jgi:predicted HTH domain antitoxin
MIEEQASDESEFSMRTITLDLPDDVFSALRRSPEEFLQEMRLAAAIHWYSQGALSQEKAAEVAGLDRTDFLLALARDKVEAFPVDLTQLAGEVERG